MFGVQDATYDGVYRQSLAILAYAALDAEPPAIAVDWLLDQQCSNGGWQAFRADTDTPCAESDIATYSGPDSNSTAVAVQALAEIGEYEAAGDGLGFLESLQQSDGGIAYLEGAASDTNSTALTAMAASAIGIPLDDTRNSMGISLLDALDDAQIECEGAPSDRGGYRFQISDEAFGNDYASAQAVLGATGLALPVRESGSDDDETALTCPAAGELSVSERTSSGAWYLAQRLDAGNGTIESAYSPGTADWSSTRFAVISLAASGHGRTAMTEALAALAGSQATTIPDDDDQDRPGVLAELILANEAARSALAPLATGSGRSAGPAKAPSKPQPAATTTPPAAPTASESPSPAATPSPEAAAPSSTIEPADAADEITGAATDPAPATAAASSPAASSPAPATPSAPAEATPAPTSSTPPVSPSASSSASAARSTIRAQAETATIDSDELLERLDATLQQAAATTTPPTTSKAPAATESAAGDEQAGGSGSDLARTGGALPLGVVLPAAAALLAGGIALLMLTSRRSRGAH